MFSCYSQKSRAYSTIMNLKYCLLISVDFHICGYEYIFTKLYSHIGMNISRSLSLHMHIMDTRRQYERGY